MHRYYNCVTASQGSIGTLHDHRSASLHVRIAYGWTSPAYIRLVVAVAAEGAGMASMVANQRWFLQDLKTLLPVENPLQPTGALAR